MIRNQKQRKFSSLDGPGRAFRGDVHNKTGSRYICSASEQGWEQQHSYRPLYGTRAFARRDIRSGFGTTYTGSGLTLSVNSRRCPFRKQSSSIKYKFFHDPTGNATVKASTTKTSCSKGDASDTNSMEAQDDDAGCASRYNNTNLRRLFRESGRANGPELAFGCERTNLAGLIPANP